MNEWHGYFILQRLAGLGNDANWNTLRGLVNQIVTRGLLPDELLAQRASLDNTQIIYKGRFEANQVNFDRFKSRLASSFGVDEADVSYTTGAQVILRIPSIFATYRYNTVSRLRIGLFACSDESNLSTLRESQLETNEYLRLNVADWEIQE